MKNFPPGTAPLPTLAGSEGWSAAGHACSHLQKHLKKLFPARDFITGHAFEICECSACGFTITSPQPAGGDMAQYYPAGYYGTPEERRFPWIVEKLQRMLYAQRARSVEGATDGVRGKVLDIGCGRGLLLKAFQARGWEVQGTELSDQSARYARQVAGIPVKTGNLGDIGFPANHFDAITMWHVLEHVPDPRVLLREIFRILKPNGVLLVGVPDFGGWEARLFRDKWFHLDVPRHVTHLTKDTLHKALSDTGFTAESWSGFAPEYDLFSFVQSALNRCGLQHNLLYNLLRGKQAKVIDGGRTPFWQVPGTFVLAVPMTLLGLPVTTIAGMAVQGGTVTVVARKPAGD
ncbi:MAG TPA: class I SAM-dependent methyltransferase [Clostridia bacterium]|nr:class I SAM-dependent methyltransferase [Clostridia bacterium]